MATDLKSLAVMVAGGFLAVGAMRNIKPDLFGATGYKDAIIKLPEFGLGVGKNNINNTTYLVPAAVAAAAYFLM